MKNDSETKTRAGFSATQKQLKALLTLPALSLAIPALLSALSSPCQPAFGQASGQPAPAPRLSASSPPDVAAEDQKYDFDKVQIAAPKLEALISITKSIDPYKLDASGTKVVSLGEVLRTAVSHNLDIKISDQDLKAMKWNLFSSYADFLPTASLAYRYQYLQGKLNIPFFSSSGGSGKINSPFIIANAGFTYYAYRGGKILNTALQNRNYVHASSYREKATLSDTLFEATKRYLNLILSEAILEIRIRAVETSVAQLQLNENLLAGGKATKLDVLQARTQLSSDRQELIDQQIERRVAAISLADLLNIDQGVDLTPANRTLEKRALVKEETQASALLRTAIETRPELKQFKELWLAAKKQAKIDSANLQPSMQFFGQVYGIGETLGNSSRVANSSLSPITLSQVSPGTPGSIPVQRRVSRQIAPLYTLGYGLNWNFAGMGGSDFGKIESAQAKSRQAMLELNKKLNTVTAEVRESYLRSLSSARKLDETKAKVESAVEELRLAQIRFQHGVGKNIDVLKAQEDFTSALIENARAIVAFNISQAQLLRDTGIISVDNLLAAAPLSLN